MRHVSDTERRERLVIRHRLDPAARAGGALEVARSLVVVHSTDPASVHLGVAARMANPSVSDIERALYEERTLARIHGMRRTLFVVPADLAPVVQASCTDAIAAQSRRRYAGLIESGGIASDGLRWLRRAEEATLAALPDGEELTGAELSQRVPMLRETVLVGEGKKYEARQAVTPWVLTLLADAGPAVWWDGRVVGGWAQRAGGEVAYRLLEDVGAEAEAAVASEAERLTRWLAAVRVTPRFRTPLERRLSAG